MKFVLSSTGMVEIPEIIKDPLKDAAKKHIQDWLQSSFDALGDWLLNKINEGWTWIVDDGSGPICLFLAMVFLLFAMFGSKRGARGVYWTITTYIIIQILGIAIRGY